MNTIENWPFLDMNLLTESQIEGFHLFQKHSSYLKELELSINQYFEDIQKVVNNLLMEKKKEMLMQFSNYNGLNQKIQTIYDQISDVQTLRQKMMSSDTELLNYLREAQNNKEINTKKIENEIDTYVQEMSSINTETPLRLKEQIVESICKINFFDGIDTLEKGEDSENDRSSNNFEDENDSDDEEDEDNKIYTDIKNLKPGSRGQNICGQVFQVEKIKKIQGEKELIFIKGKIADEKGNIDFEIKNPKNIKIRSGKNYNFKNIVNKVSESGFHYISLSRQGKVLKSSDIIQNPNKSIKDNLSKIEYIKKVISV